MQYRVDVIEQFCPRTSFIVFAYCQLECVQSSSIDFVIMMNMKRS